MIQLLIKRFIKDYDNVDDSKVRTSYGLLTGILGLFNNFFLFALKLTIGLVINSIAVTSDAFNNLSDFGTSLIQIYGVKVSGKPPDDHHPNGHGRFEYISSLVVSFMILGFGLQLLRNSIEKIIRPDQVEINGVALFLLLISILVKVWMFTYNRKIAKKIDSQINRAAAIDSLNDSIATSVVVLGTTIGSVISLPVLDGILGLLISALILYSGFQIAKDSAHLLIGTNLSEDRLEQIRSMVLSAQVINAVHDLVVHDYGPGRIFASIHAEVSAQADLVEVHDQVDDIEKKIKDELGISIVIHMDPVKES